MDCTGVVLYFGIRGGGGGKGGGGERWWRWWKKWSWCWGML